MRQPRVLLIEDDAAVRQFVLQALQPLELSVVPCASAAEARLALAAAPADLLFTDLELPDGSGVDLIREVLAPGVLAPKVVVYSGGLYAAMRDHLNTLGVWRNLVKPSSCSDIEDCVREALGLANWPEGPTQVPAVMHGLPAHEQAAIETYFDGDQAFYRTFRQSCVEQFHIDVRDGDAACLAHDASGLRRTAHSLKSVLQTLGYADHSLCARALEQLAQQEPWEAALAGWQELRQRLVQTFQLSF